MNTDNSCPVCYSAPGSLCTGATGKVLPSTHAERNRGLLLGTFVEYTGPAIDVTVLGIYSVKIVSGIMGHIVQQDRVALEFSKEERYIVALHPRLYYSFSRSDLREFKE